MSTDPSTPRHAATRALDFVSDGMIIGLGTGRAAEAFVEALAERARQASWVIQGVATSRATAALAGRLAIPLVTLDAVDTIDLTVDGADEVDSSRNVIKGRGGALVRERVIASASRRWVLCVGADKRVTRLGERGALPVEVVPFAAAQVLKTLHGMGLDAAIRQSAGQPFMTDNGNPIIDLRIQALDDPATLHDQLRAIAGVIDTGLFLGMSPIVITQRSDRVDVEGA
jgi:ribose 5-phosphate isomerase A